MNGSIHTRRGHGQWVNVRLLRRFKAFNQTILIVFVHQETNGPSVHAVNGHPQMLAAVQRLQHKTIPTQGDDNIGFFQRYVGVPRSQCSIGGLSHWCA